MADLSLEVALDTMLNAVRQAGEITLRYFQQRVDIENKRDGSPVTIADRQSEQLLRRVIEEKFPDHGIIGEEFGAVRAEARYRWLLDPIDGTVSFIHGVPLYGVMAGLEDNGEAVLGIVHFPALSETMWAYRGGGAWWNGRRARVSEVRALENATLLGVIVNDPGSERLQSRVKIVRGWGDCYGHMLVATGRAEIMLDPVLSEWDTCALLPIVEEAGGRFTDWRGVRTVQGASGISTNGALHEAVMAALAL